jgi:hypothetical protein
MGDVKTHCRTVLTAIGPIMIWRKPQWTTHIGAVPTIPDQGGPSTRRRTHRKDGGRGHGLQRAREVRCTPQLRGSMTAFSIGIGHSDDYNKLGAWELPKGKVEVAGQRSCRRSDDRASGFHDMERGDQAIASTCQGHLRQRRRELRRLEDLQLERTDHHRAVPRSGFVFAWLRADPHPSRGSDKGVYPGGLSRRPRSHGKRPHTTGERTGNLRPESLRTVSQGSGRSAAVDLARSCGPCVCLVSVGAPARVDGPHFPSLILKAAQVSQGAGPRAAPVHLGF